MTARNKPCLGYPSRSAACRALRAEGKTTAEIAALTGLSKSTVCALARKGDPIRRLTADEIADIVARRERGQGYGYIAAIHKVSPGAVHYHCLKAGAVSPRQTFRPVPTDAVVRQGKRTQRCFTQAEDQQLLALSMQGLSISEISRRTGRATTSVSIRLMTLAMREEASA